MPIEASISVEDREVSWLMRRIYRRTKNLGPVLATIGEIVQASIQRNFEEGGRPEKWKALAPSTIKQREKTGKWPGKILVRRGTAGGLQGSISYRVFSAGVTLSALKKYSAAHHFGREAMGRRSTLGSREVQRGVSGIPARPFMMLQDEDWREIEEELKDYLLET